MKRVIRLTESDLARIVRRVISEQGVKPPSIITNALKSNNGAAAFSKIESAMYGPGTNEGNVMAGVSMIKTKADYDACLAKVKAAGYPTIMAWIATDMDYRTTITYDRDQAAYQYWPGEKEARNILARCEAILKKFNSAEKIVKVA
jgi:hypothetical protein